MTKPTTAARAALQNEQSKTAVRVSLNTAITELHRATAQVEMPWLADAEIAAHIAAAIAHIELALNRSALNTRKCPVCGVAWPDDEPITDTDLRCDRCLLTDR